MNANTPEGMHSLQGSRTPPGMYWSAAESARRCGVSRATIDRAIKAGKLAAEKDAEGSWRISPHALAEAGLNPGKPSPPEDEDTLTEPASVSAEVHRLTVELARVQADAARYSGEQEAAKNQALAAALTDEFIQYLKITRWNGSVPQVQLSGSEAYPVINLPSTATPAP